MCACQQGIAKCLKEILQKKIHLHTLESNSYDLVVRTLAQIFFFPGFIIRLFVNIHVT